MTARKGDLHVPFLSTGWKCFPSLLAASGLLLLATCKSRSHEGSPCKETSECDKGLVCRDSKCVEPRPRVETVDDRDERYRRKIDEERIAALEKEVGLLRQSGVEPAIAAEEAPPGPAKTDEPATKPRDEPARTGQIRVSKTDGQAPIFAACRRDERLVGGGCRADHYYVTIGASYPSQHGEEDTMGARWNCDARSTYVEKPLGAYALCMRVRPESK